MSDTTPEPEKGTARGKSKDVKAGNDATKDLFARLIEALSSCPISAVIEDAAAIIESHGRYAGRLIDDGLAERSKLLDSLVPVVEGFAVARCASFGLSEDEAVERLRAVLFSSIDSGRTATKKSKRLKEAIDFAGLSSKYGERIWKTTDNGPKLSHIECAYCVLEEAKLACVDLGIRKQFYLYDPAAGRWQKVTTTTVKNLAVGIIGNSATDSMAGAVVSLVATLCEVSQEDFNSSRHLINLANTAFDLDLCRPASHDAEHMCTYALPYVYDPDAKCPYTDQILSQYAVGDPTWIDCFWEMAGFCIQSPYFMNKMFWLVGDGANGKSTVQRLLHELVGHDLTKTGFQVRDLSKDFFLTSVKDRRLALCGDAAVRMDNIDLLKQYTGGDHLSTNVKFGDYVQFENTAKLILCMNRAPLVSSHEALKPLVRRIVWLPFEYRITQPDPSVEKRMLAELPGHFNKAVEGLMRLRTNGKFTTVERGEKALAIWAGTANLLEVYMGECLAEKENSEVRLKELWDDYQKWMNQWGGRFWESDPFNIRNVHQLSREIIARFRARKETKYCSYWDDERKNMVRGNQVFLQGVELVSNRPNEGQLPDRDLF